MCTDNNSLNSGNIIWKSCPQSILFLEKMLKIRNDEIRYSIKIPLFLKVYMNNLHLFIFIINMKIGDN